MSKELIVIIGPTAVGKTAFAVNMAKELGCPIISADSRQFYKELSIGTAKPTEAEMDGVPHHFVGTISIDQEYSAGKFEVDVIALLDELFKEYDQVILTGGSGLYIDAVCNGVDDLPPADPELRESLNALTVAELQERLKQVDPAHFEVVDEVNPHRLIRAIEVTETTGIPYSAQRGRKRVERPFKITKVGLDMDRETLYDRINRRVDIMMSEGLLDEVRSLLPHKNKQALQTVGYRELIAHLEGSLSLEEAVEEIKKNSRRYAKRQLTWWRKDEEIDWRTV